MPSAQCSQWSWQQRGLPQFRAPRASNVFLAMLSVQMERLAVDYSNRSQYGTFGQRMRAAERQQFLQAHSSRGAAQIPVAELHTGLAMACPSQKYLLVDSDALLDGDKPSAVKLEWLFQCAPRRGLIVAMRTSTAAAGYRDALNCGLLPKLEGWGLSFDPISTARLARGKFCCMWDKIKKRTICCNKCCVEDGATSGAPLYFFVKDDALLKLGQPGSKLGGKLMRSLHSNAALGQGLDVGLMLSADRKYLPVARTVMHVLRNQSALPAVVVGPNSMGSNLTTGWPYGTSIERLTVPNGSLPAFDYVPGRREYGFRLHKLPMLLLSPYEELTIFLDADVYPCSRTIMRDLLAVAKANPNADMLLIREGKRAFDEVNYVHGGFLMFRTTPLARAFVRTWLRRYLVDYKIMYEAGGRLMPNGRIKVPEGKRGRNFGSVYEQPALSETTHSFLEVLGPSCVHWFPTGILARPNTGQIGLYRARVDSGHPAAPLVHINPLKDWELVEDFVVKPGCGTFSRFIPAKPRKGTRERARLDFIQSKLRKFKEFKTRKRLERQRLMAASGPNRGIVRSSL